MQGKGGRTKTENEGKKRKGAKSPKRGFSGTEKKVEEKKKTALQIKRPAGATFLLWNDWSTERGNDIVKNGRTRAKEGPTMPWGKHGGTESGKGEGGGKWKVRSNKPGKKARAE